MLQPDHDDDDDDTVAVSVAVSVPSLSCCLFSQACLPFAAASLAELAPLGTELPAAEKAGMHAAPLAELPELPAGPGCLLLAGCPQLWHCDCGSHCLAVLAVVPGQVLPSAADCVLGRLAGCCC